MKKILFLFFLLTMQNIFSMKKPGLIEQVKSFASNLSENISTLTKDISYLVSDTGQLYQGATNSFRNITSSISDITKGREVFEKIDMALKMIQQQFSLINDLVNILYSASKTVGTSAKLVNPFFPEVSRKGSTVANQMESIAHTIISAGIKTQEIIKPLRTAMKQITSALAVLNREISPDLKRSLSLTESVILEQAPKAKQELEKSEAEFEKELEEEWVIVPERD